MIREFQGEYRWLSNFAPVTVLLNGAAYPSVEHAYQASKTDNHTERMRIAGMTPGAAKRYARRLPRRSRLTDCAVMWDLLRQKYDREPFRSRLLATGDWHIQEGNRWYDTYWGVDLRTGVGQNVLGKMLMRLRDHLREREGA